MWVSEICHVENIDGLASFEVHTGSSGQLLRVDLAEATSVPPLWSKPQFSPNDPG